MIEYDGVRDPAPKSEWPTKNTAAPDVEIPTPTDDDIAWAKAMRDKWARTLGKELGLCVQRGYIWRVNYLLELKVSGKKDIDIDKQLHQRTPCAWALREGHYKIARLLLANGASPTAGDTNPAEIASMNDDEKSWRMLFEFGLKGDDAVEATRRFSNGKKSLTTVMLDLFPDSMENYGIKPLPPEIETEAIEREKAEEDQPDVEASPETQWEKIDDHSIVKHDVIASTNTRLQTVFNFRARQVTTVCDIDGAPAAPVVQGFAHVESDGDIQAAFAVLVERGGSPEPYEGPNSLNVVKKKQKSLSA